MADLSWSGGSKPGESNSMVGCGLSYTGNKQCLSSQSPCLVIDENYCNEHDDDDDDDDDDDGDDDNYNDDDDEEEEEKDNFDDDSKFTSMLAFIFARKLSTPETKGSSIDFALGNSGPTGRGPIDSTLMMES
ncbi:hypothetical protein RRG08_019252 [Elysia crispata]|uniref:Uncharacterized protein n=1 Tax=Elysia crispata TaxID=231223 RepID=A0AAE1DZM4_9GAST|nr:hypothetical protein RRG08_019252 [Elysia crispata]